jgi:proteasome lid subunit RPN8/RPN11
MKTKAKSAGAQPTLVIDSEVVRQIRQHARSCGKTEVCGVLIGQDHDHRIEVAACIEGQNAQEAGSHVTFTQDTWEHIYAVKDKEYPNERIVGWYHSHPGFGVFLSDHDTFIHSNFFSSPGQVAWVFDPQSDEEGCFGWVEGQIERLTRIAVFDRRGGERAEASGRPEPIIPAGDGNDVDVGHKQEQRRVPVRVPKFWAEAQANDASSSLEQWAMKVFFYLAVLALGFVLSWYFFPRVLVMPVPVDPHTGQPLDPATGQILQEPRQDYSGTTERPDTVKSGQPSAPSGGEKKKDDAKPR